MLSIYNIFEILDRRYKDVLKAIEKVTIYKKNYKLGKHKR